MAIFRIQTSATKRMPPDTSWLSNDPPDASDASFVSVAHTGWFNQFLVAKNCLQCATLLRVLNCWKFCWWRGRNTMELKNNKLRLQWLHIMHELKSLNWHHLKGKNNSCHWQWLGRIQQVHWAVDCWSIKLHPEPWKGSGQLRGGFPSNFRSSSQAITINAAVHKP